MMVRRQVMCRCVRIVMVFVMVGCKGPTSKGDYPRAEWDRAVTILMHTPGDELFDGVIHPSAGLFEHYFDVDEAAKEHRQYIEMLESNGIEVLNVCDILREIGIDTLRSLVYETLRYDLTDVVSADTICFGELYKREVVWAMSRNDLIRVLMHQPEVVLHSLDNNTKVEADWIHHPLMNLYFTRDQSITTPKGVVMCRMNSSQRSAETRIIAMCYAHLGLDPILAITGDGRLEGGDYIPAGEVCFIGCGMRTNMEAIEQMMEADVFGYDTVIVVKDHLNWQMEMHLDTRFNIIDRDLCTMQQSRMTPYPTDSTMTADVYARGAGSKDYCKIEEDVDFVALVLSRGLTIIPISKEDEMHYANNYLTIGPRHIMAVGGQSEAYKRALSAEGVDVEWVMLESLIDGYGAAHCMTQVLMRK